VTEMMREQWNIEEIIEKRQFDKCTTQDRQRYVDDCGGANSGPAFDTDLGRAKGIFENSPQALKLLNATFKVLWDRWRTFSQGPDNGSLEIKWEEILSERKV